MAGGVSQYTALSTGLAALVGGTVLWLLLQKYRRSAKDKVIYGKEYTVLRSMYS